MNDILNNIPVQTEHLNLLLLIGIAIFGGTVGAKIFQKIRIPQVVGYACGKSSLSMRKLAVSSRKQPKPAQLMSSSFITQYSFSNSKSEYNMLTNYTN